MRRVLLVVILLCVLLASLSAFVRAASLRAEGEDYACLRIYNRELTSTLLVDLIGGSVIVERHSYAAPYRYYSKDIRNVRSSDNQKVLYVRRKMQDYELRLSASLDAPSHLLQRFKETDNEGSGAFSPDSSRFAWVYGKDGKNYLLLGDADGQNIQRFSLENEPMYGGFEGWSPDGQFIQIYFSTDTMSRLRFWDVENAQLLPEVTFDFFPDHRLQWLPHGHHFLVWEVDEFKNAKRLAIKSVTGEQLVNYPIPDTLYGHDLEVSWAPNGQSFTILQENERVVGIFTLTGQVYLTETNEAHYFGAWSADSQRLALFTEIRKNEDVLKGSRFNWHTFNLTNGAFKLIRANVLRYPIHNFFLSEGRVSILSLTPTALFFADTPSPIELYYYVADADGQTVQQIFPGDEAKRDWWYIDSRYLFKFPRDSRVILLTDTLTYQVHSIPLETTSFDIGWQSDPIRLIILSKHTSDEYSITSFDPEAGKLYEVVRFKDASNTNVRTEVHHGSGVVALDSVWAYDFSKRAHSDSNLGLLRVEDAQGKLLYKFRYNSMIPLPLSWVHCP